MPDLFVGYSIAEWFVDIVEAELRKTGAKVSNMCQEIRGSKYVTFLLTAAIIASACTIPENGLGVDGQIHEEDVAEIVENLRKAGYPEREIEVRDDDRVFVGGDAHVSLMASREMIGWELREARGVSDAEDSFRQYRTTNQVAAWIRFICIDGSALAGHPTLDAALDNAIANYLNQRLRFEIVRKGGWIGPSCDVEIDAVTMPGGGGMAGFPSGGFPYDTISIGAEIGSVANATHVITHEIGHAIGLRHSDYYDRSISCGGWLDNEGDAGVGAIHIPNTPVNAVFNGSVMNSCYNLGSTGQWTNTDIAALSTLHGVGPVAVSMEYEGDDPTNEGELIISWAPVPGASFYVISTSSSNCYRIQTGTSYQRELKYKYFNWTVRVTAMQGTMDATCNFDNSVSVVAKSDWVNYCSLNPASPLC